MDTGWLTDLNSVSTQSQNMQFAHTTHTCTQTKSAHAMIFTLAAWMSVRLYESEAVGSLRQVKRSHLAWTVFRQCVQACVWAGRAPSPCPIVTVTQPGQSPHSRAQTHTPCEYHQSAHIDSNTHYLILCQNTLTAGATHSEAPGLPILTIPNYPFGRETIRLEREEMERRGKGEWVLVID